MPSASQMLSNANGSVRSALVTHASSCFARLTGMRARRASTTAGVAAALGALNGARGGVDLPEDERDDVRARLEAVRSHVIEENEDDDMEDLTASAWTAMRELPPMPAAWFREPSAEELPPGGPGVNYANGRIFGWVAQAGEAHAGFAKKVTIDGLGRIDTSHFLRQRFTLDDGSTVKTGTFTMNAGHHRDGAECETAACQFDDTRTVAGVVTVGMNERGMWFSGAAAPWLSEWDRTVFMATQPSYHMRKGPGGNWQLRAVLAVPVPGHSSPLLASAVIERSQMALTAAAGMAEVEEVVAAETARQEAEQRPVATATVELVPELGDGLADLVASAVEAALDRREQRKRDEADELEALLAEARTMGADIFWVAETQLSLKAGSFAFGPMGAPHTFYANAGGAKALVGFAPAKFEGFLREVGEPAPARVLPPPLEGHPDMARLAPIAKRNGFEILGPPGPPPGH